MTKSRRKFLKAGFMAALFAAATPLNDVFSKTIKAGLTNSDDTPPVLDDTLAGYSKSAFVPYVDSIFQVHTGTGTVDLSLTNIEDLPAPSGGECFSLVFRGGTSALTQDTYEIQHAALGTFQLFLVPTGSDQNGVQGYTATINRLSPQDYANISVPSRRH